MSNPIWHKSDKKPTYHKWVCVKYPNAPVKPVCKFIEEHTYISYACEYAYLEDLIAQANKAERLQKAVDFAILRLEQGKKKFGKSRMGPNKETAMLCEIVIDEIKQLIKESKC